MTEDGKSVRMKECPNTPARKFLIDLNIYSKDEKELTQFDKDGKENCNSITNPTLAFPDIILPETPTQSPRTESFIPSTYPDLG